MSAVRIAVEDADGAKILRAALERYAEMAEATAVQKRHRHLHAGETRAALEKQALVLDARAAKARRMAAQIND